VSVFGVILSLEPAIAALTGFLGLGETLTPLMILAIVLIMVAAAGIALCQPPSPATPMNSP
jgi:inner membrane transporter RhtA